VLVVLNIDENQLENAASLENTIRSSYSHPLFQVVALCGKLEMELAQLSESEANEFRGELGLKEPALQKTIKLSYELLDLLSFFTTVSAELKVWTVTRGTTALKAAGKIHSDIEKGFIKAEVIHYDDLVKYGSTAEIRKQGLMRVEGKSYSVQDGDIITFLFNI
jgi:ribosome-binding ATPase YchF (GTP1/OBG family)